MFRAVSESVKGTESLDKDFILVQTSQRDVNFIRFSLCILLLSAKQSRHACGDFERLRKETFSRYHSHGLRYRSRKDHHV